MNLLEFLKKVILKIKQKSDETYLAKNDPTANVQVKDLTAKNLDLSYTAENGDKKTGKVKSDVTPYADETQNLGSADKVWKGLYISRDGLHFRTQISDPARPGKFLNAKVISIDGEGNVQIYFPSYQNYKAITISENNKIVFYNPVTKQKIFSITDGHIEMFGDQSSNPNEGQKKALSLDSDLYKLDFENETGVLSTAKEFIIIPDHGVFTTNSLETSRYNRIKFGGVEQTHFDVDADANISEEVIFSYKRAGTSTDDIPDVAITKTGDFYCKGKKLVDLIEKLSTPPSIIKDSGDNRNLTIACSKEGLNFTAIDWIAAWYNNELRKISKNYFLSTVANQNLTSTQKYYARKNIGIDNYISTKIVFDWSEYETNDSWKNYYLSIKNNTAQIPLLYQWLNDSTIYVAEICYRNSLKNNIYAGCQYVAEVIVFSVPEYGGNEDVLSVVVKKTTNTGVDLVLCYEQDTETIEDDDTVYDNWWADIYLYQIKNGTALYGDAREYEISRIYELKKYW